MSTTTEEPSTATPSGGGLRGAIASEWTKLWSVRSTTWTLAMSVVLMVLASTQMAFDIVNNNIDGDPSYDPGVVPLTDPAVSSLILVQYVVLALAMLTVTVEYSTGSIRTTLQCVPVRRNALLAKAVLIAPVTFAVGCALSVVGALSALPWLAEWGEPDPAAMVADTLRIGTYLALVCLFTLGVGAVIRSAVGTLITIYLVLGVLPGLLGGSMLLPAGAGQSFLTDAADPWNPVIGLAVLAAWSALSLFAGTWALRSRDA